MNSPRTARLQAPNRPSEDHFCSKCGNWVPIRCSCYCERQLEMKVFPARPPSVPFKQWAETHGGYLPEAGSIVNLGCGLILVRTSDGERALYRFDYQLGAYRRLDGSI